MTVAEQSKMASRVSAVFALHAAGNVAGAIRQAREILSVEPDNARLLGFLAYMENCLGQTDQAAKTIRHALQLDPNSADAHRFLGMIELRKVRPYLGLAGEDQLRRLMTRPLQAFQRAVKLAPRNWSNHLCLAQGLDAARNADAAEASFRQALSLGPQELLVLTEFGNFLLRHRTRAEAAEVAKAAATMAPDNDQVCLLCGRLALLDGRLDEARDRALWVLRQRANDPAALRLLAQAKLRRNPVWGLWWRWVIYADGLSRNTHRALAFAAGLGGWAVWDYRSHSLPVYAYIVGAILFLAFMATLGSSVALTEMVRKELRRATMRPNY